MGRHRPPHGQTPPQALVTTETVKELVRNEMSERAKVHNGLASAIGYGMGIGGGYSGGGNPFDPGTAQVAQPGTIFRNLRWYLVSNFRQVLNEAYVEIGLVQTIVDVPVDDALRGGIEIKSKELGEEGVAELLVAIDRDDDLGTMAQAAKWNRLFGGAGVLVLTDQDPQEPLDVEALSDRDEVEFRACDLWELNWDAQNVGGYSPTEDEEQFEFYSYYGQKVHKSRVLAMKGKQAPSFIRPRLRGWGFSVVEALVRSLNQYLKGTDLTFEVLDEFKLDIFKIKGLTDALMSPQGEEAIRKRIQMANWQKNYQNALSMDAEDDFDHKQLSFSGLAEAGQGIRMQVASDMRMPLTKLFGISAAGFNSGEDDLEVYNAMVESEVRQKIKYDLLRMLEIKCQILFGFIPDDLSITFKPLRVLSAEATENVKTQKFTRLFQAKAAGELTTKEFREACNKGELFDITLDTNVEEMGTEDEATDEDEDDKGKTAGANKPESSKPTTPKSKPDAKDAKVANWDEGKHPRADDGKFGEGGGGAHDEVGAARLKAEVAAAVKKGALSGAKWSGKHGTNEDMMALAKKMRAEDPVAHASLLHTGGPKKGKKSRYAIMVLDPDKQPKRNAAWDENKHPRADDGKFGEGGGGSSGGDDEGSGGGSKSVEKKRRAGKLPADDQWKIKKTMLSRDGERGEDGYSCAHCNKPIKRLAFMDHPEQGEQIVGEDCAEALAEGSAKTQLEKFYEEKKKAAKSEKAAKKEEIADTVKQTMRPWRTNNPRDSAANDNYMKEAVESAAYFSDDGGMRLSPRAEIEPKDRAKIIESAMLMQAAGERGSAFQYEGEVPKGAAMNGATGEWTTWLVPAIDAYAAKKAKKKNEGRPRPSDNFGATTPKPYTESERTANLANSPQFDKASYEADGGDAWIDARRKELFTDPANVDEGLWARARDASKAALGEVRWQFVTWFYKKQGGRFE